MIYKRTKPGAISRIIPLNTLAATAPATNNGIGIEISGGQKGFYLTHLNYGPALITNASFNRLTTWCIVFKGKIPDDISFMQATLALASTQFAFPTTPLSALPFDVMFSTVSWVEAQIPDGADWPDSMGPRVGPGEVMSILLFPLWHTGQIAAMTANGKMFLQLNAHGRDDASYFDDEGRSIPRGRV